MRPPIRVALACVLAATLASFAPVYARTAETVEAETDETVEGESEEDASEAGPEAKSRRGDAPRVLNIPQDDQRAGEEAAEQVSAEIGIVEDEALTEYVNAVGSRLALHAPGYDFDYRFRIVDQDAPNAFALPGGFIYVSRGLLALSNSESELANVLGHEIVHASLRHAAARQQVGGGGPALFQWFRMGDLAAYSRSQERTADRLGQGLAGLAGYDPADMAAFLRNLEFTDRLEFGHSRIPGFLDTHPATGRRAAEAAERADRIAWQPQAPIARDQADYLQRLEGLTVGSSAAEGIFLASRFVHADLGFTLRFPEGWETRNTRRAVGAIAPQRDAQVYLEHQGRGRDPEKAANAHLEKLRAEGLRVDDSTRVKLAGGPAVRIRGRAGGARVVITWLARAGHIYRLTGVAPSGPSRRYEALFVNVARSFRAPTPELLARVNETRLRVVPALTGESLKELSDRSGNAWQLQKTAVMNRLFADQPLQAGQLIKVAVAESYRPVAAAP